jgi:hypothetical protein
VVLVFLLVRDYLVALVSPVALEVLLVRDYLVALVFPVVLEVLLVRDYLVALVFPVVLEVLLVRDYLVTLVFPVVLEVLEVLDTLADLDVQGTQAALVVQDRKNLHYIYCNNYMGHICNIYCIRYNYCKEGNNYIQFQVVFYFVKYQRILCYIFLECNKNYSYYISYLTYLYIL